MAENNQRRSARAPAFVPEEKQFDERVLHIDRVARVVKGGRRFRFRALVVVGDRKGRVGVATSKGADVTAAVAKATDTAKKNMFDIKLYNGTFPHEGQAKVGGANIFLKPASPGTGLIAGGVVRTVLEVAGVHNALSKSLGSSNKVNTAYATLKALDNMVPADKWITRRSKSLQKTEKSDNTEQADKPEKKPQTDTNKPVAKKEAKK